MTNVYLTGKVSKKRLDWALDKAKTLGPALGPGNVTLVLAELGIDTYADFFADGTFSLHELSDLQWVAFGAALQAFKEGLDEDGLNWDPDAT